MKGLRKEIIILAFIVLLFGLYKIINISFGYDTDLLILNPKNIMDSWLSLSRYGLVFLKYIFNLYNSVDLRVFNIITYINVFVYCILFLYFLNLNRKSNTLKNVLSIVLVVTSPILLEQFGFTLQSIEVSFGIILMMITFILTYYYLKDNNNKYLFIIIPLLVLCFGIYQSFFNLYVLGVLISVYKIQDNYKNNIIKSLIIFIVSSIIYFLVSTIVINVFDIEKSSYLTSQIGWSSGFLSTLLVVIKDFIKVIIGYGNILNLGYAICLLTLILNIKAYKNNRTNLVMLLLIILSPLLLNSVSGSFLTYRSLLTLPFMVSFIFFEFYYNKLIRILFILLMISQLIHCVLLEVSDYNRYKNDVYISNKIYSDCGADENTIIYLYGIEKSEENISVFKGETLGYSYFEWSIDGINLSDYRVKNFMDIHNLKFKLGDSSSNKVNFESEYPMEGYYIKDDNKCYVNFGN